MRLFATLDRDRHTPAVARLRNANARRRAASAAKGSEVTENRPNPRLFAGTPFARTLA
jgi:hypothetical protein